VLGDGGHTTHTFVAGVAILVLLPGGVGEAAAPLFHNAGREPALHHLAEALPANGEELGAVVEDALIDAIGPHAAADLLFLFEDRDGDARILQGLGGDQAGEAGADYHARLYTTDAHVLTPFAGPAW
jgi:hypothetical protein